MRLSLNIKVAMGYHLLACVPAFTSDKKHWLDKIGISSSLLFDNSNHRRSRPIERLVNQVECGLQHIGECERRLKNKRFTLESAGAMQILICSQEQYRPLTETDQSATGKICPG